MTELDPIKRASQMYFNSVKAVKQSVDRFLEKNAAKAKQEAFLAELKGCADECSAIMGDSRYPRQVKWLTELRASYSRALERTNPALTTQIAMLQGKIDCLDTLLSEPKRAINEYEKMSKGKGE